MLKVEAIIPAAGLSLRMASAVPKPLIRLGGTPILVHTLRSLLNTNLIRRVTIAVNEDYMNSLREVLEKFDFGKLISPAGTGGKGVSGKTIHLVGGGKTRTASVRNCLRALSPDAEMVLVHDAVRPFIDCKLVSALLRQARNSGAAVLGVPVKSTLKMANAHQEVSLTLYRDSLWEIQTPQVFKKEIILAAYKRYRGLDATDDSSLVEKLGQRVKIIKGSYFNIKITTPEDLVFAEAILRLGYGT